VTEAEWLAGTDPEPMLEFLRGRAGERKLRLFALGCCERVAKYVRDGRSRAALAFAWQYVEAGVARRRGRPTVWEQASQAWREAGDLIRMSRSDREYNKALAQCYVADIARHTVHKDPWRAAVFSSRGACLRAWYSSGAVRGKGSWHPYGPAYCAEGAKLADLLRDVLGNPFRPPKVARGWLVWGGGNVKSLAQRIYEDREFGRLPVLADALEEAGCTTEAILSHCRQPGEHVRGCWVVDLLTGRE
jgi:hypothetical protein